MTPDIPSEPTPSAGPIETPNYNAMVAAIEACERYMTDLEKIDLESLDYDELAALLKIVVPMTSTWPEETLAKVRLRSEREAGNYFLNQGIPVPGRRRNRAQMAKALALAAKIYSDSDGH